MPSDHRPAHTARPPSTTAEAARDDLDGSLRDLVPALAGLAESAARAAGALVRETRPSSVEVAGTKTSPVDVVTAMDVAAEELLIRLLLEARPDDGILGEERGWVEGSSGITWVLDPIDGTVNYLYGIPAYAVSVAAVSGPPEPARWTALAGCVHGVADGSTWTAGRGTGARLDGVPLGPVRAPALDRCLVGTGFGYRADRRRAQGRVLAELLPSVRDVRRIGSAALDICAVATGRLDLYFERGLNPWDLAAAALVAEEAGAVVTGLRGEPAGEAMTVVGAPPAVQDLVAELERLDADRD